MTKLVPEIEPPKPKKPTFAECPRCARPLTASKSRKKSIDVVVITLRPCGCMSHSSDGHYRQFVGLVKGPGSLS